MKRKIIIETIVFLYATLFLYSGISKLTEYSVFKEQLTESPLLAPISSLVATSIPWVEFLSILMLIIPRWRLQGFYSALALMITFTIYIVALLSFSSELPCSCGGILGKLSWPQHVIFNVIYIILAIGGIILEKREKYSINKTWPHIRQNNYEMPSKGI